MTTTLSSALSSAVEGYVASNPASKSHYDEHLTPYLPGGNTRTVIFTPPFPILLSSSSQPCYVTDLDGHTYTDLAGELTAGLYGHRRPEIIDAVTKDVLGEGGIGLTLGGTGLGEGRLAKAIGERFGLERVRFCCSGTEANLHALALARHVTKKRKVLVFTGGYHGSVISFPLTEGAANNVNPSEWIIVQYNDVETTRRVMRERKDELAAVILEGMQGSGGCIQASKEFLQCIETEAKANNIIFILDEVMTSRLAPGGIQSLYCVKPSITTLGKYLGGGFPFGGLGGSAELMAAYDPRQAGSLTHSGTFNNCSMTMHAGWAGLTKVYTPEVCKTFNASGDKLRTNLQAIAKGTKMSVTGMGSMLNMHFTKDGILEPSHIQQIAHDDPLKDLFWMEMLKAGFWITRRGMLALVLDTPEEEFRRFEGAVKAFLEKWADLVKL